MRDLINIVETAWSTSFEELAQRCATVDEFIRKTDGMDVLYRGHYDDETPNHVFMTDYVGHAREYAGGEGGDGRIDAYAYDPNDVLFFDDARFDEMRNACRRLSDQQLATAYKTALNGNRFAAEFGRAFTTVKKIIRGDTPYSVICGDPSKNDPLVPLLQAYAHEQGKNIIAFHGSDYADYGGQTEYVVGDVSKLTDLRKLYAQVRGAMGESVLSELSRPSTMEDAEPILTKAGWKQVGTGYYGAVYAKPGVDYVLKLFHVDDRAYRAFLALVQQHPNKHFPIFRGKPIKITRWYWAVRMEKLSPVELNSNAPSLGVYLLCRDKGPFPGNKYQVEAFDKVMEYLKSEPELKQALDLIIDNLLTKYNEDLHHENFMKRTDGTLVITDPVRT